MTAVQSLRTRQLPWIRWAAWAVFLLVAVYLPQQYQPLEVQRFTRVIYYAIAILSLNLLTGFNGQISLGHGAFFGVGAYTTVILVGDHGWSHLATVPAAAVVSFVVGVLAGIPALRIRGLYLALTTLALATVFPTIIQHYASITGGTQGRSIPVYKSPFGGLAQDQWGYYLALAFAVVIFVLVRNLIRSRVGRALIAVRDNEVAAEVVGVNLALYKVGVFGVSAMIAGVAGSISILVQPFPRIDARSFTIALSITFLIGMVIGGAASIVGPILGALFIERAPRLIVDNPIHNFDPALTNVIYGLGLIVLMFLMPGGVIGLWNRIRAFVARRTGRGGPTAVADAAFASNETLAAQAADAPDPTPA